MRKLTVLVFLLVLGSAQVAYASSCQSGNATVLQAIPAIAKVFAPLTGVSWQDFANNLAGICAVESGCDPNTKHVLQNGQYSQYQGLYQMNMYEVTKAENYLNQVYPQLQQMAQSGQIPQDAWTFFQQAVQSGRSSGGDRRFLPEYGVILGAAKHIQIQKQLQTQYSGDALRQAAGHMVAQFSGIAESQIAAGNFNAPVTGVAGDARTEAGALSLNRVSGTTLAGAIESAGVSFGSKMVCMMTQMSQVTGGLTTVPKQITPFNAPPFMPGTSPLLSVPYSGVSTLMEDGMLSPASVQPVAPSAANLPPLNPYAPQTTPPASYTSAPVSVTPTTTTAPASASSSSQCTPQYSCTNNTVYYQSNSCSTSVFQKCQYGCSGTICAAAPSSATSSQLSVSNIISTMTGSATSAENAFGALEQLFATSTSIGTTTSLTASSSLFSFVQEGTAISLTTGATTSIAADGEQGFGQPTFATSTYSYSQNVYVPARISPFAQILAQLKNVMYGFISYLQTI
jgi:hypothetical protein